MKYLNPEVLTARERYLAPSSYKEDKLEAAIDSALKKVDYMVETLGDKFPSHASINNVYEPVGNDDWGWNQGFWSGILWIAYEMTGNEKYRKVAEAQIPSYYERIKAQFGEMGHDVGFLYSLSCVAAYKRTGNELAKKSALLAADHLKARFRERGQFIKAWGSLEGDDNYRLIVDCLMNIPLLYWATEATGDESYKDIAYRHFKTTIEYAVREDGSSFHTYYFDFETGAPLKGVTKQGKGDDSCWARGHGWIIYGMMLTRKYIDDPDAVAIAKAAAAYYLNRLPRDFIPYWDLGFVDGDGEEKDSSAAPIALCGLIDLLNFLEGEDKAIVNNAIDYSMESLYDTYSSKDLPECNGLLIHAVYSKPDKVGIDECNIWGCYFYMECLMRLKNKDWNPYW